MPACYDKSRSEAVRPAKEFHRVLRPRHVFERRKPARFSGIAENEEYVFERRKPARFSGIAKNKEYVFERRKPTRFAGIAKNKGQP
ncbi:MAG: hypothetical protein DU429_03610 [Candidatus Tokpelaia sp.]|nr:MAG: hypothetical protein DU429_03610 [Candidatus Tokpelaia sp.]KAA6405924.1 hypothetical protein DPQ22_01820 [Candidatus Tokpelaia sp.]